MPPFVDRQDAGRLLAEQIQKLGLGGAGLSPIVLGIPRGGVVVAFEVACGIGRNSDPSW